MIVRRAAPLVAILLLGMPTVAVQAQSGNAARLSAIERRLDAIGDRPAGSTVAQASDSDRITAIERRLDALEQRLGKPPPQSASPQAPAVPGARAGYRALGLKKGLTEAEVVALLGRPLRIRRGVVDVFFYGDGAAPNVDFQYGRVIDWTD
jgi:hypothetical protein